MLTVIAVVWAETGLVPNEAPVADAGVGLMAQVGDTVILNGMASSDPEGAALTFVWTQVGGPEVELRKGSTVKPELTLEAAGTHRFALVVNDGVDDSEPDVVEVVVPERSFGGEAGCSAGAPASAVAGVLAAGLLWARRRARP